MGRGGIGAMPPQLEVVQQLTQMGYDEGLIRRAAETTGCPNIAALVPP